MSELFSLKGKVAQLARNLAVEWGPANVRVNSISPGPIATEFARPLLDNPELLSRRLASTPLRRCPSTMAARQRGHVQLKMPRLRIRSPTRSQCLLPTTTAS